MDLGLTDSETRFRDELRGWLKANLPAKMVKTADNAKEYYQYLADWQQKLYDGGWAGVSWPKEYGGRGASFIEQAIFQEEMALADAPERMGTIGQGLV
jgi:alkylation response protein AidB-like acyl-CoA dehydrogenase